MKKPILMSLSSCVLVVLLTGPAAAVPVEDTFFIEFDGTGELVASGSGGSGYNGGAWYPYPNNWWNQWFYDDPFDPDASKLIDVWMTITPTSGRAWAEIAINWSTDLYPSNPDSPPLPPLTPGDEAAWIFRELIFSEAGFPDLEPVTISLELPIVIPDYNPEWVSIDIRGANITVTSGVIRHECIPEPATVALLGLGALSLIRRRRA